MSSKIDALEPNSSEPLAILLASIVASISTPDSAEAFALQNPGDDIARQAELAIAGVPLGLARGVDGAGGRAAVRSLVAAGLDAVLVRLRNTLGVARRVLALLQADAALSARTSDSKLLHEIRRKRARAHSWLVSSEKSGHVTIGAAAAAVLTLSFVVVQLSTHGRWFVASQDAGAMPQPDLATAAQAAEERPSSADIEFTRANIRYCTFQQIRLEALGPITEGADLVVFNALVEDWNARCTKYHYRPEDKAAVDAEAGRRRALLEVEGRALMNGWRRKIVTTVQQRPVPAVGDGGTVPAESDAVAGPERASDATEPLPLLITLGRAVPEDADRLTGLSLRTPALALLRADVAVRVQRRLNDLGYTISPLDGTWGTMSRTALVRFKKANGLLVNDAFDAETVTRLFSTAAKAAPAGERDEETATVETSYPPPPAAGLNPLNRADGQRVQQRLVELGYYTGRGDGAWGAASRSALRSFKAANGLPADEEWNAMAEAVLFDEHAVHASDATTVPPRAAVMPAPAPAVPLPPKRPPRPAARAGEAAQQPPGLFQALSKFFASAAHGAP